MTVSDTIASYRKRRKAPSPLVIGLLAIILVLIGIIVILLGFGDAGRITLFATKTPTPTITPSPTNTPIPTDTPTITPTATHTPTATPSAPYEYVVQQGDYLGKIAEDHGLGENGVVLILLLNPYKTAIGDFSIDPITQVIYVGQRIMLPNPGMPFPTPTPWPTNIPAGTKILYFVLPGDSLASIALKCNSTVDAIVKANKDILKEGANTIISPGWLLLVPVNLVKPVPTAIATATPSLTPTP